MEWILILASVIIVAGAMFVFLVWRVLAPSNRFFTFVQEGTCKVVVRADAFEKALIQWQGFTFDLQWNVVPDGTEIDGRICQEPNHPFGGLRFYGLWPLLDILIHRLRWHDIQRTEERGGQAERPVFHDEVLDCVLLRPDVYWTKLLRAETGGEGELERIPLDVEFLTTMQVVNPYKAQFVAPIGWVENVLLRLMSIYRGLIASKTLDELLRMRGRGDEIWSQITQTHDFSLLQQVIEGEWGIRIVERGIQIKDIELPQRYQDEAAQKWEAERVKDRTVVNADAEKIRIETVYGAIESLGDLGRLIRVLEAVEKSPLAASLTVQAIPGLQEVLRGVFGKTAETITREEFQELRRIVEEIERTLRPQEGQV